MTIKMKILLVYEEYAVMPIMHTKLCASVVTLIFCVSFLYLDLIFYSCIFSTLWKQMIVVVIHYLQYNNNNKYLYSAKPCLFFFHSTKETLLKKFQVTIKPSLQNYWKILKKCTQYYMHSDIFGRFIISITQQCVTLC